MKTESGYDIINSEQTPVDRNDATNDATNDDEIDLTGISETTRECGKKAASLFHKYKQLDHGEVGFSSLADASEIGHSEMSDLIADILHLAELNGFSSTAMLKMALIFYLDGRTFEEVASNDEGRKVIDEAMGLIDGLIELADGRMAEGSKLSALENV